MFNLASEYKTYRKFGGKSYKLEKVYTGKGAKRKAKKKGKKMKSKVAFSIKSYRIKRKGNKYLLYVR